MPGPVDASFDGSNSNSPKLHDAKHTVRCAKPPKTPKTPKTTRTLKTASAKSSALPIEPSTALFQLPVKVEQVMGRSSLLTTRERDDIEKFIFSDDNPGIWVIEAQDSLDYPMYLRECAARRGFKVVDVDEVTDSDTMERNLRTVPFIARAVLQCYDMTALPASTIKKALSNTKSPIQAKIVLHTTDIFATTSLKSWKQAKVKRNFRVVHRNDENSRKFMDLQDTAFVHAKRSLGLATRPQRYTVPNDTFIGSLVHANYLQMEPMEPFRCDLTNWKMNMAEFFSDFDLLKGRVTTNGYESRLVELGDMPRIPCRAHPCRLALPKFAGQRTFQSGFKMLDVRTNRRH